METPRRLNGTKGAAAGGGSSGWDPFVTGTTTTTTASTTSSLSDDDHDDSSPTTRKKDAFAAWETEEKEEQAERQQRLKQQKTNLKEKRKSIIADLQSFRIPGEDSFASEDSDFYFSDTTNSQTTDTSAEPEDDKPKQRSAKDMLEPLKHGDDSLTFDFKTGEYNDKPKKSSKTEEKEEEKLTPDAAISSPSTPAKQRQEKTTPPTIASPTTPQATTNDSRRAMVDLTPLSKTTHAATTQETTPPMEKAKRRSSLGKTVRFQIKEAKVEEQAVPTENNSSKADEMQKAAVASQKSPSKLKASKFDTISKRNDKTDLLKSPPPPQKEPQTPPSGRQGRLSSPTTSKRKMRKTSSTGSDSNHKKKTTKSSASATNLSSSSSSNNKKSSSNTARASLSDLTTMKSKHTGDSDALISTSDHSALTPKRKGPSEDALTSTSDHSTMKPKRSTTGEIKPRNKKKDMMSRNASLRDIHFDADNKDEGNKTLKDKFESMKKTSSRSQLHVSLGSVSIDTTEEEPVPKPMSMSNFVLHMDHPGGHVAPLVVDTKMKAAISSSDFVVAAGTTDVPGDEASKSKDRKTMGSRRSSDRKINSSSRSSSTRKLKKTTSQESENDKRRDSKSSSLRRRPSSDKAKADMGTEDKKSTTKKEDAPDRRRLLRRNSSLSEIEVMAKRKGRKKQQHEQQKKMHQSLRNMGDGNNSDDDSEGADPNIAMADLERSGPARDGTQADNDKHEEVLENSLSLLDAMVDIDTIPDQTNAEGETKRGSANPVGEDANHETTGQGSDPTPAKDPDRNKSRAAPNRRGLLKRNSSLSDLDEMVQSRRKKSEEEKQKSKANNRLMMHMSLNNLGASSRHVKKNDVDTIPDQTNAEGENKRGSANPVGDDANLETTAQGSNQAPAKDPDQNKSLAAPNRRGVLKRNSSLSELDEMVQSRRKKSEDEKRKSKANNRLMMHMSLNNLGASSRHVKKNDEDAQGMFGLGANSSRVMSSSRISQSTHEVKSSRTDNPLGRNAVSEHAVSQLTAASKHQSDRDLRERRASRNDRLNIHKSLKQKEDMIGTATVHESGKRLKTHSKASESDDLGETPQNHGETADSGDQELGHSSRHDEDENGGQLRRSSLPGTGSKQRQDTNSSSQSSRDESGFSTSGHEQKNSLSASAQHRRSSLTKSGNTAKPTMPSPGTDTTAATSTTSVHDDGKQESMVLSSNTGRGMDSSSQSNVDAFGLPASGHERKNSLSKSGQQRRGSLSRSGHATKTTVTSQEAGATAATSTTAVHNNDMQEHVASSMNSSFNELESATERTGRSKKSTQSSRSALLHKTKMHKSMSHLKVEESKAEGDEKHRRRGRSKSEKESRRSKRSASTGRHSEIPHKSGMPESSTREGRMEKSAQRSRSKSRSKSLSKRKSEHKSGSARGRSASKGRRRKSGSVPPETKEVPKNERSSSKVRNDRRKSSSKRGSKAANVSSQMKVEEEAHLENKRDSLAAAKADRMNKSMGYLTASDNTRSRRSKSQQPDARLTDTPTEAETEGGRTLPLRTDSDISSIGFGRARKIKPKEKRNSLDTSGQEVAKESIDDSHAPIPTNIILVGDEPDEQEKKGAGKLDAETKQRGKADKSGERNRNPMMMTMHSSFGSLVDDLPTTRGNHSPEDVFHKSLGAIDSSSIVESPQHSQSKESLRATESTARARAKAKKVARAPLNEETTENEPKTEDVPKHLKRASTHTLLTDFRTVSQPQLRRQASATKVGSVSKAVAKTIQTNSRKLLLELTEEKKKQEPREQFWNVLSDAFKPGEN